jgi:hypothetical protein
MAGRVERKSVPPQDALLELGQALAYALENPKITARGKLLFGAPRIGDRDPISRYGGGCPRMIEGFWTLPDLVELAILVQERARDLGAGKAGRKRGRRRRA